jgi:hypothetical protein
MNRRELSLLVPCVATLLLLGCSKKDSAATGDAKADAAAADAKAGDAKADPSADAKADAAGELPEAEQAASACPPSLSGTDKVDRVITKECGVVPVTADYAIDGATLTLEAGATLAFAEGTRLTIGYYEPAKLVVKGTAEAPVTFTTSSADKVAGVWQGVRLEAKASRSRIEGLVLEHAGGEDAAALLVEAQDVTIGGTTVRSAKGIGIEIADDGMAKVSGTTLADVGPVAMRVTPAAAGGIAADNRLPAEAVVQVQPGVLGKSATWNALGVPWVIGGQVQVHGAAGQRATLTLAPGAALRFGGEGSLTVGYYAEGGLVAEGTADAPITFSGHERQEPGAWGAVRLFGKAEARLQHVALRHGGRQEAEGALMIDGPARVSLQDASFTDDAVGVVVQGGEAKLQAFDRVTFERTPVALRAPARHLGSLGAANTYVGEPRIVAEADKLDVDATWRLQAGAMVELEGLLQVSGVRLLVDPGVTVHVADGVEVQVGYYENAGLELRGTAEAPITFRGRRDEPGSWGGIVLFGKAKGNVLEHVVLRNAGGQAGVRFDGESSGKVEHLRCDACSAPGLTWTCKSKVEHQHVVAGEGTPKDYDDPACN